MKKLLIPMLLALLATTFAASAFAARNQVPGEKSIIIFYSLSGNTKMVAETLRDMVGADILEIQTVRPYPPDFHAVVEQARKERRSNFLPPIQSIQTDLRNYDIVYLGFPIWGNTIPQPMATFLSQNNLAGKTVIPFCTHDGYGVGRSFRVAAEYCPEATMLDGFDMLGSNAREARQLLAAWLQRIGVSTSASAQNSAGALATQYTPISITIGDTKLEGILNDGSVAREFMKRLPVTVDMGQFGGREYYGGISERIVTNVEGRLRFDDGDITYCPQNNTIAIFYAQTDRPNLTMRVIPIGKVTSDLGVFQTLPRNVRVSFKTNYANTYQIRRNTHER